MSTLQKRLFYGTLLLLGTLGLLTVDYYSQAKYGFLALLTISMLLGWKEFLSMAKIGPESPGFSRLGYLTILSGIILHWQSLEQVGEFSLSQKLLSISYLVSFLGPMLAMIFCLKTEPSRDLWKQIGLFSFGVLYLLLPSFCCLQIRYLPNGLLWLLVLILVVKGNDIGAYLTGRKIGKTQLCAVSPNKSREGSLGGLSLGTLVALGICLSTDLCSWWAALIIALVIGVFGQLGDLCESFMKRAAGQKDSGNLVPTFGGMLDILDSLLFGAPVLYFLILVMT